MSYSSKAAIANAEQLLADGLRTHLPKAVIPINGKLIKSAALQQQLLEHVRSRRQVAEARATYLRLVAADDEMQANLAALIRGIRNYATGMFGEQSIELATMGFQPRRKARPSPATKVLAADKLRATRAARHTMGKRQKAAIHGAVPAATTSAPTTDDAATPRTPISTDPN